MENITAGTAPDTGHYDMLILLFPVHAFNAPEAVYKWIDKLEASDKTTVAVISVSGGGEISPNTACRLGAIERLENKGYHVNYENMIVMPSNCILPMKEPLPAFLIKVLPEKAGKMIDQILSGERVRTKPLLMDKLCSAFGELEKRFTKQFGKNIKVHQNCIGCGWCSRHCPAGNITMVEGRPVFDNKCYVCLKCIYGCTAKALIPGSGKFLVIKEGYPLDKWKKENIIPDKCAVNDLVKGFAWSGVRKYLSDK
jgi:ferredoxin